MEIELRKEQYYIKAYHKQKICQDGEQKSNSIRWIAKDRRKAWCSKKNFQAEIEHKSVINDGFFRTLAKGVLIKKRKAKKEDDFQILQVQTNDVDDENIYETRNEPPKIMVNMWTRSKRKGGTSRW